MRILAARLKCSLQSSLYTESLAHKLFSYFFDLHVFCPRTPLWRQDEVTGSTKVSCGLRPALSRAVAQDINHSKPTGSSPLQRPLFLRLLRRGYQQGSGNSVYNRPTYSG